MNTVTINYQYNNTDTIEYAVYNNKLILLVKRNNGKECYMVGLNVDATYLSYTEYEHIYISSGELNIVIYTQDTDKAGAQETFAVKDIIDEVKFKEIYEDNKDILKQVPIKEGDIPESLRRQDEIEELKEQIRQLTNSVNELNNN